MTLPQLQDDVDLWIKTVGVRYFSVLTNTAILAEEVGEVARLMARMYGDQSFREEIDPDAQKKLLGDEMADVLWVLVCLANQTGIDLEAAMKDNIAKKTKRDASRHINNTKLQ